MSITPLPSPPEPTDSTSQFNTKAFAWVAALDNFTTEANALTANVNALEDSTIVFAGQAQTSASQAAASATASANSATTALGHASAAAANTNAPLWVSGTTYAAGALVYSAVDGRTYRRKTAGSGTTNPASDSTNWTPLLLEVATLRPTIRPSLLLDFANSKRLDPRITYSRASTGTFYDGKTVAKAEENLLTYSQEFDQAATWFVVNTTVSTNSTTAPDGTTTAETLTETTVNGSHRIGQTFTALASPYVFSVFLKKGAGATAPDWVQLLFTGGNSGCVNFNLTTGVVGTAGFSGVGTITSVGGGWFRCTLSQTSFSAGATTASLCFINNSDSSGRNPSYAGATTSDVFLWGAQLEQRSSVTAYTPTTTQPITNYIPVLQTAAANVARFQHNPTTGESEGFWVEEQRANLLLRSEEFDNAAWVKTNATITANLVIAPDGTQTGDAVVASATGVHVTQSFAVSIAAASSTTASIWIKAAPSDVGKNVAIGQRRNDAQPLQQGYTTVTLTAQWQRVPHSITWTNSHTSIRIDVRTDNVSDPASNYYIWGAQLEAGAFPTSYIKTEASQVTRSADAASMTGTNFSSWYNAGEGTIYVDWRGSGIVSGNFPRIFAISDNTANNRLELVADVQFSTNSFLVRTGGVDQAALNFGVPANNTDYKIAGSYKFNDFAASRNGASSLTDASGTIPVVDRMNIGAGGVVGANIYTGTIKKLAFYSRRLSNAELQALTS